MRFLLSCLVRKVYTISDRSGRYVWITCCLLYNILRKKRYVRWLCYTYTLQKVDYFYCCYILVTPCIDIDECDEEAHDCGLLRDCVNTAGSFDCFVKTCPLGYRLNYDTGNCQPLRCHRGLRPDISGRCVGMNNLSHPLYVCLSVCLSRESDI